MLLVSFSLPFTRKRQTATSNCKRHKMSRDRAFLRCVCHLHGLFERVDGGLHVQTLNSKRKCNMKHGITSPSPSQASRDHSAHRRATSTCPRGIKLCTVECNYCTTLCITSGKHVWRRFWTGCFHGFADRL